MTDPRPSRTPPRFVLSPLEWRLYIVAALAVVYLVAWRSIIGDPAVATTSAAAPAQAVPSAAPPAPPAVWLDDLPIAHRPALTAPPGWRVATRGEPPVVVPAPRVVRAPASRPLRVRTRSS